MYDRLLIIVLEITLIIKTIIIIKIVATTVLLDLFIICLRTIKIFKSNSRINLRCKSIYIPIVLY